MGAFNHEHAGRLRRTGSIGAIFITACVYLAVPSPVRVRANVSISAIDPTGRIAAGDKHTCAIAVNNIIWCWGDNQFSQLGSAVFPDTESLIPIQTTSLPGSRIAYRIVAGANHTCVLATDGTVWCWGQNGNGNLGDGSLVIQGDPVQAVLGGIATAISAGGSTTCAVLSDNRWQCWGRNNRGQLGNSTWGTAAVTTPVYTSFIPAWFTIAKIEIGGTHSCAISVLGIAWCWGQFSDGRLGTTASSDALTPTATASLGGTASEVAAGGAYTCALLTNGNISCFGSNNMGQLGQTPTPSPAANPTPTVVTFAATASHITAGGQFTCVLLSTGVVHCFGDNASGQLGSGSSGSARETPGVVTGLTGTVVDVVAGASHACAVMSTGQVRCWGKNDLGQLGIGTQIDVAIGTEITTLNVVPTTTTTTTTTSTTTTTTTTTVAPSTIAPTTVASTTTEATSSTTSTSSTVPATEVALTKAVVLIHPMTMRPGTKVSAAKLVASVSMTIPKRSVGSMRISITKGKQYCAFVGTSLKAVRKGKCTIVVIFLPKKGRSVLRSNILTVKG